MAVAESMIGYFCMLTLFANTEITKDNTLFSMGDLSFVAALIVINVKLQIIEMHNKSIVAGFSVFLSTGAILLWNILLAAVYPPTSTYKVRGAFFLRVWTKSNVVVDAGFHRRLRSRVRIHRRRL